jgi:hypothetical protein
MDLRLSNMSNNITGFTRTLSIFSREQNLINDTKPWISPSSNLPVTSYTSTFKALLRPLSHDLHITVELSRLQAGVSVSNLANTPTCNRYHTLAIQSSPIRIRPKSYRARLFLNLPTSDLIRDAPCSRLKPVQLQWDTHRAYFSISAAGGPTLLHR